MASKHIVVLGAGYAGIMAALRLSARLKHTEEINISLINGLEHFVERPRLHQIAGGYMPQVRSISDMLKGTKVVFRQGWVTAIHPARKVITVDGAEIAYDKLVVALGSAVDTQSVPGVREHAFVLNPFGQRDSIALRSALRQLPNGARIVVIGGGATGVEAAPEILSVYPSFKITVITQGRAGTFKNARVETAIRGALVEQGIGLLEHSTIKRVEADRAILANGDAIPSDLCLWAGGFTAPALAQKAGIQVNARRQIETDPFLRSLSHPDIYAVGDSAWPVETPGAPYRMSLYAALVSGAHAANNIAAELKGKQQKPFSFAYYGQAVALGHHDAVGFATFPADQVIGPIYRGALAVNLREFFVKLLTFILELERRFPGFFFWIGQRRYARSQRRTAVTTLRNERLHG